MRPGERSVQARRAKPSTATENGEQNARQARDWQATVRKSIAAAFYRVVQLARPSDVPGVQGELLPAGAWGSAPHLLISQSAKIPFVSFAVLCVLCGKSILAVFVNLCGPSCSSCFSQNTPPLSIAPPVARLPRALFSVLCSLFSVLRGGSAAPQRDPRGVDLGPLSQLYFLWKTKIFEMR